MKLAYQNIFKAFLLLVVAMQFSCRESFLDIEPKGKLIAKKTADYDLLFNNTPLINTGTDITSFPNGQIAMGDEVIAIDPFFSAASQRTQRLFSWEKDVYNPDDDNAEMNGILRQLYVYNKIAVEIKEVTDGTELQRNELYAEALANRAWCYFMLINYYGKPYHSSTAAADPGFPIIKVADVAETSFKRATVQEVYDFMIQDLTVAIPLLPVNTSVRARFCKSAAMGLLGKIYVFMGRYRDALPQFNNCLANLPTTFSVALYDLNITMANVGAPGAWGYNPATNPNGFQSLYPTAWNNTENIFCKQVNAGAWNADRSELLLKPEAADLFNAVDMRRRFFSDKANGGTALPIAKALRRNSGTQVQIGIRLADIYLLSAETKARLNDITGAITDLEALTKTRLPNNAYKVNITDQNDLIRFIIDERTREFALTGFRWFDIRRLSVDPLFSGVEYKHQYYSTTGSLVKAYTLIPERMTLRFTDKVMNANPGMQNNP